MKVQVTVHLAGAAQPIVIQSPALIGITGLDRLARLLDGESPESVFPPSDPPMPLAGLNPNQTHLIGIMINDAPPNTPRQVYRMFVAEWPLVQQLFPGVIMERFEGRWHSYPGVYDDLGAGTSIAFVIRERWPKVMHRIVKLELDPLLRCAWDYTKISHAKIGREVLSRCNLSNQKGMAGFFAEPVVYNIWQLAAHWHDWQERGASIDERLNELGQLEPPVEMTALYFQAVCEKLELTVNEAKPDVAPHAVPPGKPPRAETRRIAQEPELMTLHRVPSTTNYRKLSEFNGDDELETIATGGSYPTADEATTLMEKEMALVRNWDPAEDAVFSYGGPADLSYDVDSQIATSFPNGNDQPVTFQDLFEKVWWWKAAVKKFKGSMARIYQRDEKKWVAGLKIPKWQPTLFDPFRDNWERSAFFYEFRARYQARYEWKPFGKPWVKLNHTQRGILACMWPPTHVGMHRIQPNLNIVVIEQMKRRIRVDLALNVNIPPAQVNAMVAAELKRRLAQRGILTPQGGKRGSGAPKMLPWRALQFLDLEHFLQRKFPDNDTKLKLTTHRYVKACEEFGIAP